MFHLVQMGHDMLDLLCDLFRVKGGIPEPVRHPPCKVSTSGHGNKGRNVFGQECAIRREVRDNLRSSREEVLQLTQAKSFAV